MHSNRDIKRKLTAYRDDGKMDELLLNLPGINQLNNEAKEAIGKALHFFIDKLIRQSETQVDKKASIDNTLLQSFDKLKTHGSAPKIKKLFLEAAAIILNENTSASATDQVKKIKKPKRNIFDYDDEDPFAEE